NFGTPQVPRSVLRPAPQEPGSGRLETHSVSDALVPLLRRAELIRVRAEHAAVTFEWSKGRSAALARVEVLARVLWHRLAPLRRALWTGDRRDSRYHCISARVARP